MKYELIKIQPGHRFYGIGVIYQIRALKDFNDVKKGDLGGYVTDKNNLSQRGNCWIYDNAQIFEDAQVSGNARMYGTAQIYNYAKMYNYATMYDNTRMYGNAAMCNHTRMYGNAAMYDTTRMYDNAELRTNLYGVIFGDIKLTSQEDIKVISHIGSDDGILTLVEHEDVIYAARGCFKGTLEELIAKAKSESNHHYDNIEEIANLLFK